MNVSPACGDKNDQSQIFRNESRDCLQLLNELSASAAFTTEFIRRAESPP